ncbi:MAG: HAMP domain-containing histidine kinase [Planctomycetes bacterium]|nr:HAMP domain-containing histidine kinase [Planctomycetota bacterium]
MELDLKEFNLGEMLETSLAMFKDKALKHNLKLGLDPGEGAEKVTADAAMIRQIMLNLLGNAVKFTPEGGRVHIRTRRASNFIEISVADTGIGISEEYREKLSLTESGRHDRRSKKENSDCGRRRDEP